MTTCRTSEAAKILAKEIKELATYNGAGVRSYTIGTKELFAIMQKYKRMETTLIHLANVLRDMGETQEQRVAEKALAFDPLLPSPNGQ